MAAKQHPSRGGENTPPKSISSSENLFIRHRSEQYVDDVPEDWLPIRKIAVKVERSERTAREMMRRAEDAGEVEVRNFRIRTTDGTSRVAKHYRLKDNE